MHMNANRGLSLSPFEKIVFKSTHASGNMPVPVSTLTNATATATYQQQQQQQRLQVQLQSEEENENPLSHTQQMRTYATQKLLTSSQYVTHAVSMLGLTPMKPLVLQALIQTPNTHDNIGYGYNTANGTGTGTGTGKRRIQFADTPVDSTSAVATTFDAYPVAAASASGTGSASQNGQGQGQGIFFTERVAEFGCASIGKLIRGSVVLQNTLHTGM